MKTCQLAMGFSNSRNIVKVRPETTSLVNPWICLHSHSIFPGVDSLQCSGQLLSQGGVGGGLVWGGWQAWSRAINLCSKLVALQSRVYQSRGKSEQQVLIFGTPCSFLSTRHSSQLESYSVAVVCRTPPTRSEIAQYKSSGFPKY